MDAVYETKRRLDLAKRISQPLERIVDGVMLGGSMGFGQNYSVSNKSDIDMVVVLDRKKLPELMKSWYFKDHVHTKVQELFSTNDINLFWVTRIIDTIEVNAFVYDTQGYKDFCTLKNGIRGYINHKPEKTQSAYSYDGEELLFNRRIVPMSEGFIYEKPALANNCFWGGVPRQDFFYSGFILYEKNSFLKKMEKLVWTATVKQLIKEHGKHVDLSKYNILNTHFTYQTAKHRLPSRVVDKILDRTEKELKKLI